MASLLSRDILLQLSQDVWTAETTVGKTSDQISGNNMNMKQTSLAFTMVKICPLKTSWMCFVMVLMGSYLFAQQAGLDSLKQKFDSYRVALPQEKIYLHTDQELYLVGETLWFKLYYTDATLHYPMDISKVAYVEILDADNRPVLQTKVALKSGQGNGSLFLPASINSGNYHLRAYTQWMKNFSPEYFFHKKISIINSFKKVDPIAVNASKEFIVQFFPEGGNLISGLNSKIAFKATQPNGRSMSFNGLI